MPFISPGLTNLYARKKEREDLPKPGMGEHVIGLLANLLAPELVTAISRWAQGHSQGPQDFMADLLPDDPSMGMPMPDMGMVRWRRGLEYPTAFLNRRIGRADEVDALRHVYQRGLSTQKPASLITPNVTGSFGDSPYALIFSPKGEKSILESAPWDLWSKPTRTAAAGSQGKYSAAIKKLESVPPWKLIDKEKYNRNERAIDKLLELWESRPHTVREEWQSTRGTFPRSENSLEDYFAEQLRRTRANPFIGDQADNPLWKNHSEFIYQIGDPEELAAVRLPPTRPSAYGYSTEKQELYDALQSLANERGIPQLRLPMPRTAQDSIQQLENPLRGNWLMSPEGIMYSSEYGPTPGLYY